MAPDDARDHASRWSELRWRSRIKPSKLTAILGFHTQAFLLRDEASAWRLGASRQQECDGPREGCKDVGSYNSDYSLVTTISGAFSNANERSARRRGDREV